MHTLFLLLQATTTGTVPSWLGWLIPLIAAPLTTLIVNLLRRMSGALDNASPTVKRVVAFVTALVLNWLGAFLGIGIPANVDGVTVGFVTSLLPALLSALAAMGIYHLPSGNSTTPAALRREAAAEDATNTTQI